MKRSSVPRTDIDPKILELVNKDYGETLELVNRTEWHYTFNGVEGGLPAISQMVTADILKERDRELGFHVLKNAGAFPKEVGHKPNTLLQDNRLQIAIQTLVHGSHA
jgi:hypothetical protein